MSSTPSPLPPNSGYVTPSGQPPVAPPNYLPPGTPPDQGAVDRAGKRPGEIKVIGRSMLFYWWPVWAVAFFCAAWTFLEDNRLAVLPSGGKLEVAGNVTTTQNGKEVETPAALTFTLPAEKAKAWHYNDGQPARTAVELSAAPEGNEPFPTRISRHPALGMAFVITLLMVVFTTNVPLRGLWSLVVFLLLFLIVVIISLIPGAWEGIGRTLSSWLVYMNLATYLIIGGVVFILWAVAFFIFDPRQFVIFAPGQIRVCEHIGDAVEAYSSSGVQLTKQRDDPFRHMLLGFGSSDIVLKFAHGDRREIRIPNVLGLSFDMKEVEQMIRTVPS